MRDELLAKMRDLARRAGLGSVSPAVLAAGLVVLVLAAGVGVWRWWPRGTTADASGATGASVLADSPAVSGSAAGSSSGRSPASTASAEPSAGPRVWVDVVGAVRHPGLYQLGAASRVNDAIEAAGGFLGNAAVQGVNLARPLTDGEQLIVPTADEFAKGGAVAPGAGGGAAGASGAGGTSATPVDVNGATADQLDALPGIGPATATKIVADRATNGPFKSIDDLGRVAGIGPKKLEDLRALIVVH